MTDIHEPTRLSAVSAAPEHVRVSVVAARTQLDVALPVDVPVANLVPELVKLVRSRDVKAPADATVADSQATFRVLTRADTAIPLGSTETLRAVGVVDGEMLHLKAQHASSAPILYDDVVDAAARLNKAAYVGWNTAAARWMSFVGLGLTSLIWVYFLLNAMPGEQRTTIVGLAALVVAIMVGVASLAHRTYAQAEVGAAVGWSTIPISAAMVWALVQGVGGYAVAAGSIFLAALNLLCYWAVGTGRWGYLASIVFFLAGGSALLSRAAGLATQTASAALAVAAALACLTVSRLTGRLVRFEPSQGRLDANRDTVTSEDPSGLEPASIDAGANRPSSATLPTAEAVWGRTRSAAITRSALYVGLGLSVFCGAAIVLRNGRDLHWAALVFAWVCALALALHARIPNSELERFSLAVSAVALAVAGCVNARCGTAAMASTGLGTLVAIAVIASLAGVKAAGGNMPRRTATVLEYLQYVAFAALIPVALWTAGVCIHLDMR